MITREYEVCCGDVCRNILLFIAETVANILGQADMPGEDMGLRPSARQVTTSPHCHVQARMDNIQFLCIAHQGCGYRRATLLDHNTHSNLRRHAAYIATKDARRNPLAQVFLSTARLCWAASKPRQVKHERGHGVGCLVEELALSAPQSGRSKRTLS